MACMRACVIDNGETWKIHTLEIYCNSNGIVMCFKIFALVS